MWILQTTNTDNTEIDTAEAVEATVDFLQIIFSTALGTLAGLTVAVVLVGIARFISSRQRFLRPFVQATGKAFTFLLAVIGGALGFWAFDTLNEGTLPRPGWFANIDHIFLIFFIFSGTWLAVTVINGSVALIQERVGDSSKGRAKRVQTQMQILHRVINFTIWICGTAGILLTFPLARAAGASILASAGLVSVIAGLAAQTTLSNIFSGLQLAFTDSIRVGDIVHYKGNYTSVEEITLTYVVLAVWDGRRVIVPSKEMTTESFENWTRRKPDMIGEVTWEVDWAIPIDAARKQLNYVLQQTDLWDGKTGILQVIDAKQNYLVLKAIVSAQDSSTMSDLKNYLREQIVLWIQQEALQAIPHSRVFSDDPIDITASRKKTEDQVTKRLSGVNPRVYLPASLALPAGEEALKEITAENTDGEVSVETKSGTGETVVINPRKFAEFKQLEAEYADEFMDPSVTLVMPKVEAELLAEDNTAAAGAGIRRVKPGYEAAFFTGSAEAEERKKTFAGPGEEAFNERNRKILAQTGEIAAVEAKEDRCDMEKTKLGETATAPAEAAENVADKTEVCAQTTTDTVAEKETPATTRQGTSEQEASKEKRVVRKSIKPKARNKRK